MTIQTAPSHVVPFTVEERQNYSPAALRAIFRMEDVFHLSDTEMSRLLGGATRSDVKEWKRAALAHEPVTLPNETLNRVRIALLVFNQLGRKFPQALDKAEEWLRRTHPSPAFGGRSPLALLMDVEARYGEQALRYTVANPLVNEAKTSPKPAPKPVARKPRTRP